MADAAVLGPNINSLALRLKELKDKKAALDVELDELKSDIKFAELALADAMVKEECANVTIKGYSYSLTSKEHYSVLAADREAALLLINHYGYVPENVYSQRFESRAFEVIMREIVEENGGELPEEFDGIVNEYIQTGVSVRKAKK